MINENFIIVGAVLNAIGSVGYFIDTIKGKAKPNRVTWFFWALAPLIAFVAELQKGVGLISLITFTAGFCPLFIFGASLFNKKSYWKLEKFDIFCGVFAGIGLVLWWISREATVAIFFSIMADVLASLPTVIKSYHSPQTENANAYLLSAIGALLGFLTIKQYSLATIGYPMYIILLCTMLFIFIQFKVGKKRVVAK